MRYHHLGLAAIVVAALTSPADAQERDAAVGKTATTMEAMPCVWASSSGFEGTQWFDLPPGIDFESVSATWCCGAGRLGGDRPAPLNAWDR